jgi:hypothetical protein
MFDPGSVGGLLSAVRFRGEKVRAPAVLVEQGSEVVGVVAHTGELVDDVGDAGQGPVVAVEAEGVGALGEGVFELRATGWR